MQRIRYDTFYSRSNINYAKKLVIDLLHYRLYKIIFIATAIGFAIFYMFATGIFFYGTEPLSDFIPVPHFRVIWPGDVIYDQTPWFIGYLTKHLVFRMNSHALASTILLSLLFAVNTMLFTHRFRLARSLNCRCEGSSGMPVTVAGLVPASFSAFACHGALLLPLLGLSFLSPYGNIFVAISIGALALGTLLVSNGIRNVLKANGSTGINCVS